MNQLRIKLTPTIKPAFNGKAVIGECTVSFVAGTSKASKVTAASQPATFELVEVGGPGDATTAERVLFSVVGTIIDNAGAPFFDAGFTAPTLMFDRTDSAFFVLLEFDKTTVKVPNFSNRLFLPWESSKEKNVLELRARLKVNGAMECDIGVNDVFDIPMEIPKVPEDGTSTTDFHDCIGVGALHPTKNDKLKPAQRVAFAGKKIEIFLMDDVRKEFDALSKGAVVVKFVIADVTTELNTIFADAGFGSVTVNEVTATDARFTAIWSGAKGKMQANNVTGDPTASINSNEGIDIPFFQYWFSFDPTGKSALSDEVAHSEIYDPALIDFGKKTKRAYTPIMFEGGKPALNTVMLLPLTDQAKWFASTIAHEIGHSLGVMHSVEPVFKSTPPTFKKAAGRGVMSNLLILGSNTVDSQLFGPVHKDVLKKHYL